MFLKIDFKEIDVIFQELGGSLVLIKGFIFIIVAVHVRNKWKASLVKAIHNKIYKEEKQISAEEHESLMNKIITRCSFEGVYYTTERVDTLEQTIKKLEQTVEQ